MSPHLSASVLLLVVSLSGCGEDDGGPSAETRVDTLLQALEYPTGLWVAGGAVYFTETAGRNTSFGGKVRLGKYVISNHAFSTLLDQPVNSDAVVTVGADVYLGSYIGSIPGNAGAVSVVDAATGAEIPVTGLEIAVTDMTLDQSGDIYVIGGSDTPDAASLYRLSAGDYADTTVVKRGLGRTFALARDGGITFFADLTGIRRLDGSGNVTPLVTRSGVRSLAVAGEYLYFADFLADEIVRVRVATGEINVVLDGLANPAALRYDAGSNNLYFLEGGSQANEFKDGLLAVIRDLLP